MAKQYRNLKRPINCFITGLLICICGLNAFGQNKIDSLLTLIKKDKEDTNKVKHLNALGWELKNNNPDTCITLSNQALNLSKELSTSPVKIIAHTGKRELANSLSQLGIYYDIKGEYQKTIDYYFKALKIDIELHNKKGIGTRYGNLGRVYASFGDYSKALDYYMKALKIDEELHNLEGQATRFGNMGIVYFNQGNHIKALDFYFKALKISEKIKDENGVARHLGNIGGVYFMQENYAKALEYNFRVFKIATEINDKALQANCLGNIGAIYYSQKNHSKAIHFYNEALKTDEELGNKYGIARHLSNIAVSFSEQGNYSKALDNFLEALKKDQEIGNKNGVASDLGNIGSLYIDLKNYPDAFKYIHLAILTSDSIGSMNNLKSQFNKLSTVYEKSDVPLPDSSGKKMLNSEEMRLYALHYFKKYLNLRDTLFSEESKKQLIQKEMNYDFEKKEAATKAEQDKKDALAKETLKQKEEERNYFIVGFALVGLLAMFIFRGYRQKQKANEIISHQKQLVEEKQKEILDSIHYAKRIQQSLLPTERYIEKTIYRLKND